MNKLAIVVKAFKSVIASNSNNQTAEFIEFDDIFHFTALDQDCTIALKKSSNKSPEVELEYSTDGEEWTECKIGNPIKLVNAEDNLYFRAAGMHVNNSFGDCDDEGHLYFTATKRVNVSGNIMSLMSRYKRSIKLEEQVNDNLFDSLFENMTTLIDASKLQLPAMELTSSCYQYMFCNCGNLVKAPELPAIKVGTGSCHAMFYGCTSLKEAPRLPAEQLDDYCYMSMFEGCTNLLIAPDLPALSLCESCYCFMFRDCQNLSKIGEIKATALSNHCCDSMFCGCENLIDGPILHALELQEQCYASMFAECKNLSSVTIYATDVSAFEDLEGWLTDAGINADTRTLLINAQVYASRENGTYKNVFDVINSNSSNWTIQPIGC